MVKQLRAKTGAGMMDCKKALTEADGDMERAVDELRKRGQAIAQKKVGRATGEGRLFSRVEGGVGVLVEVNCETDFVAKNEEFAQFGRHLADLVAGKAEAADPAALAELTCPEHGRKVGEALTDLIAKVGENMSIGQVVRLAAAEGNRALSTYVHPPGKLGVMVELEAGRGETLEQEAVRQLGRDLAMHVAAAAPLAIDRASLPADQLERERQVYREQVKHEGKPEKIWDRIVEGKMGKFYRQACLLEQEFVKDPEQTVGKLLEAVGKQVGDTISVSRFVRMEVGGDQADG
jgi:elongation factor Ts